MLQTIFQSMLDRRGGSEVKHSPCKGLTSDGNKLQLLKQVVKGRYPYAWRRVQMSRVLGDGHYKKLALVTVGVSRKRSILITK